MPLFAGRGTSRGSVVSEEAKTARIDALHAWQADRDARLAAKQSEALKEAVRHNEKLHVGKNAVRTSLQTSDSRHRPLTPPLCPCPCCCAACLPNVVSSCCAAASAAARIGTHCSTGSTSQRQGAVSSGGRL